MAMLDAICMQFIAIGESLKGLDKITNNELLTTHPEIPWKRIKGLRDIVAHHYFEIDIDVIWWILSNELQSLKKAIISMLSDLSEYPLPFSFLLLIETHPVDLHLDRQIR